MAKIPAIFSLSILHIVIITITKVICIFTINNVIAGVNADDSMPSNAGADSLVDLFINKDFVGNSNHRNNFFYSSHYVGDYSSSSLHDAAKNDDDNDDHVQSQHEPHFVYFGVGRPDQRQTEEQSLSSVTALSSRTKLLLNDLQASATVKNIYEISNVQAPPSLPPSSKNDNFFQLSVRADTRGELLADDNLDGSVKAPGSKSLSRRETKENLCEGECGCSKKNSFISIYCDLYQSREYVFDEKKYIPPSATSIIIKLAPSARLRIEQGLFADRKVNRILIEGTPNSNEHIEIRENAMMGSKSPFPDIEIINCHTLVLRANAFKGEFKFNVTNCHDVIIYPFAFHNTSVYGTFSDIKDLRIHEQAFNNAKAKLTIINSQIDNLNRFEASLREIRFINCSIGIINTGTFDVLKINSIVFESCKIDVFRTRAITEKLLSDHLAITGAIIGIIESEAIAGSGISELTLSGNEIDIIQEHAIHVTAVNASITNNKIKHAGHEWLRVKDWTNISIVKNTFGDFGLIQLEETANPTSCVLQGNFVTRPAPGSLNITNRNCVIREMSFYQPCTCNISWLQDLSSRDLRSESYCTVDDTLKFCFNTTIFNVLKYEHEICDYTEHQLDCLKNMNAKKIQGNFLKPEDLERNANKAKLIYILTGVGVLSILVIIAFVIAFKCVRQKTSQIPISNIPTTTLNGGTTLKDMRQFSHDDRIIINQTLQKMKEKYFPEVYDQVYENTQILLRGNITEMQRVKAIGDIVQILGDCPNSGEDFVAFTDILYRYLAPKDPPHTNGDPVYSEPNLPSLPHENHRPSSRQNDDSLTEGQTNIDHIYAEPLCLQQPLLTNEYASPADRNEMAGLYSEPITMNNGRDALKIIPPYAIISPKDPLQSNSMHFNNSSLSSIEPSTSKNLPDVLSQSGTTAASIPSTSFSPSAGIASHNKPLTNVQKMAQNFSNNPNFHITRSPTTNRKIPKYTVPLTKMNNNGSFHVKDDLDSIGGAIGGTASETGSNHSGGSDITIKIDDIIEYADA